MTVHVPSDLEALVQRRIASGAFANADEVVRQALEDFDAEESWSTEDRNWLEEKLDRSAAQFAERRVYGREAALKKLAELRELHLAKMAE